ncbi:MAG TPA: hypothetical protein PLP21_08865 [Pyrinomonadaceae bacterium]|nr:hypothetical protein [Acidobacteriota bacterium]HQZ96417.1 hypothetical protein [Pyrinomonadaceae bacterium]
MKLATRVYVVTLIILTLVFAVSAQKSEKEPRNTAPTVGTGGPVGGPTGLFTVYDSSTLRKGEYTLSASLSNYDRDPGNVDISTVPLSFQVGLSNKFELFFTTEGYRGVKVNAPQNLSGFYLPNSQLLIGNALRRPGAIVLEPGTSGTRAIYRPIGSAFTAFPFTGGVFYTPNLGTAVNTLGPPRVGGAQDLFPGVGSVYGSILPGIVLTTSPLINGNTAPASFSTAPTYTADAPFINRTWGTSSFNTMNVGFKWRFNDEKAAWGHGITAFYRYYMDSGSDLAGFNMMQRGSGPGSSKGDIGVTYFVDARATKWANVSFNAGYLYTSKVKGTFAGADYVMFDPGDELQLSVGVDFPVNKFFQPILEFRSLDYVGGRTPNALEQNPKDGIAGFRVYPRRWFGFGLAYRYNFNQQDFDSFQGDTTSNSVTVLCGPVSLPGCVPTTTTVTREGVPVGLGTSADPHGYIANFWIGRRDKRLGEVVNQPANVDSVSLSDMVITLPCRPGTTSKSGACNDSKTISVSTKASDPENDVLTYNYTVSGGRIVGTGANVQWDLSSAQVGTYTIVTGVDDGCGVCGKTDTKTIRVEECPDCQAPPKTCSCPTLSVSGPAGITNPGDTMTFTASASGDVTYNWTVSAGSIESGQGTPSITVRTTKEMAGSNVTATVNIGGTDPTCNCLTTASDNGGVAAIPTATPVDEYGALKDDDVKARVDNFYIQLNNNPSAKGYIINYGTAAQIKKQKAQIMKAITFRKYDAGRVTFVDGPNNGEVKTKFWLVPAGADNPQP